MLNPTADSPVYNVTILVSSGDIVKIQSASESIPENYTQVDIKGKWVMPGLIDGHIHLAQSGSAYTRPDTIDATKLISYQLDQDWLNNNRETLLGRYSRLGITTVVDMGGPTAYLQLYKESSSNTVAPDIYAAGTLLAPMTIPELNKTFTKVTNGTEAKELVSQLHNNGNAILKIYWTQESGLTHQQLSDLYEPAISLAKEQGKVVAAHVSSLMDAKMAVRAGANILLHGVMSEQVDNELIELMKQKKVTYMPTLTSESHYTELFRGELEFTAHEKKNSDKFVLESFQTLKQNKDKTGQMFQLISKYIVFVDASDEDISKLSTQEQSIVMQLQAAFTTENQLLQKRNLKRVYQAGVNVAIGTDAGNPGTLHASSYYGEILAWQDAGLPNAAILKAATLNNALALNIQEKVGSLFVGKHADFIILDADPRENMATLMRPLMTIKRGIQVKGE
ncbi:amidohydrolase family protein [Colwelliaceae bacterium 6471]